MVEVVVVVVVATAAVFVAAKAAVPVVVVVVAAAVVVLAGVVVVAAVVVVVVILVCKVIQVVDLRLGLRMDFFLLCPILRPEFFYFLFYRFFRPDVRVGGRKKNKNKISRSAICFSDISDVKVGGRKKKINFFSLVFL